MKRLLFLPLLVLCLSGCMMEELDKESPVQEAKEYLVPIKMAGEILEIEEGPLTKAGENNDLYGFQINSKKAGETSYSPYAYGLFDDISDVKVKLISGAEYEFVCAMVRDGKNRIEGEGNQYFTPFNMHKANEFVYSVSESKSLYNALSYLRNDGFYEIPNIDRYYGKTEGVSPSSTTSISINMKRVVFGLKCITEGLTEGELKIRLIHGSGFSPTMSIKAGGELFVEDIFTSNISVDDGFDIIGYSYTLEAIYIHSDKTKEIIVNEPVSFKRNKKTIVTIKINKDANDTGTKGVNVVLDDTPMTDGDNVVIDGK